MVNYDKYLVIIDHNNQYQIKLFKIDQDILFESSLLTQPVRDASFRNLRRFKIFKILKNAPNSTNLVSELMMDKMVKIN